MSDLKALIKNANAIKKEFVESTIRMPRETLSFIEGVSDYLSLSKQDVMLKLMNEGIKIAKDSLELNKEAEELENCQFYLLNTNRSNDTNDQDYMIKHQIAAAFYPPWKHNIDRIEKDDIVFLYENGVGIVAYGKGSGNLLKEDRYGDKDECHYQKLDEFNILETPLSAADIKKTLGRPIPFLRTMIGIPDGKKILDKIIYDKKEKDHDNK